jgi:hypothetical protein
MPSIVPVSSFSEISSELLERSRAAVWCTFTTVDTLNRPRSRVLHPIWEGETGWVATRRNTLKASHLAHSPYVALAYTADVWRPLYVDCLATWDDAPETRRRVWDLFLATPPPVGYDPAPSFQSFDHPDFGVLRLSPWRVTVADSPARHRVWRGQPHGAG